MKVTCGFPESEKFCPFEREIRGKKRAFVFPHSMNVWLKILQFDLYLIILISVPRSFIGVGLQQCYHYCCMVLVVKNPSADAGDIRDLSSIPELERSPGWDGNPFQYS